jgi:hypothetical protein
MRFLASIATVFALVLCGYIRCSESESNIVAAVDSDFLFLEMKQSSLPVANAGLGVFSKVDIEKDQILCEYRGAVIPNNVPYKSNYVYGSTMIDGSNILIVPDMDKPICAFINDCVNALDNVYQPEELYMYNQTMKNLPNYSGFEHNAVALSTSMGKILIVSSLAIPAGSEIFYSYGTNYWLPRIWNKEAFGYA